jgi:hypothetical protein
MVLVLARIAAIFGVVEVFTGEVAVVILFGHFWGCWRWGRCYLWFIILNIFGFIV